MNLSLLLPILIILAFAVVLSNQLLQAAGVKNSIKFWTDIRSKFPLWYEHNQSVQKYITKPNGELFSKPHTNSTNNGIIVSRLTDSSSDSKGNVLDVEHKYTFKNDISLPTDDRLIAVRY